MKNSDTFRYQELSLDLAHRSIVCTYDVCGERFTERIHIPSVDFSRPGVYDAAILYFLLAGVSYYKTKAPPIIDLGSITTSVQEQAFLREFFIQGLGEFSYKNKLDLSTLSVVGPTGQPEFHDPDLNVGEVLIPFGGGIDSIVTVNELVPFTDRSALFVAERPDARFDAIEEPAAVTMLEVLRAERLIDPKLLESSARGYLNGHVPVTGILSALAVVTAVGSGFGAVAMSNERSASSATLETSSGPINHQWSKGIDFEKGFRQIVQGRIASFEYFSFLRGRSELSIAESFASNTLFHGSFRSCNRSFHQDPARRLNTWCGVCDKCLFVDLVLAPYMSRAALSEIFGGNEPLENSTLRNQLEVLVGVNTGARPFECVGDEEECQDALRLTAMRSDRSSNAMLQALAAQLPARSTEGLRTQEDFVPERYA